MLRRYSAREPASTRSKIKLPQDVLRTDCGLRAFLWPSATAGLQNRPGGRLCGV